MPYRNDKSFGQIQRKRRPRVPAATLQNAGGQPTAGGQNTAKEILQDQYARGEITREQYELRKQDIV